MQYVNSSNSEESKNEKDDLVPPGGMYVRTPMPAIKKLTYQGQKSAARVLYALSLHLGKGSRVVFPGYPTIALFAGISENNIRKSLDVLVSKGYIAVEKRRIGRKNQNHYSILPKAYLGNGEGDNRNKRIQLDPKRHWICITCWGDVVPEEVELLRERDWEGNMEDHWIHNRCINTYDSRRVYEALPGILMQQKDFLARQKHWRM